MTDAGMTGAELHAFRASFQSESNPSHLFGFASALAPDHCSSASLLHARGTLLEGKRILGPIIVANTNAILNQLAFETAPPRTSPNILLDMRRAVDALAQSLRVPPAFFHRKVRQTAGEIVVDENASFADVPHEIVALARTLILRAGPLRVLDSNAVRIALPITTHLSTVDEAQDRARWVRHYMREIRRDGVIS